MTDLDTTGAGMTTRRTADSEAAPERTRWWLRLPTSPLFGRIVLAAAVAYFGWAAWSYWQSSHDESLHFTKARDQVSRAAREEIAALNTIDGRQPDAGLRAWLAASTGPLHDEFQRSNAQNRQKAVQAGAKTEGTVTDLAVTELDDRAGSAQVIATVDVKMTAPSGATTAADRKRFVATLARSSGGWKLKSLTAVPVGAR